MKDILWIYIYLKGNSKSAATLKNVLFITKPIFYRDTKACVESFLEGLNNANPVKFIKLLFFSNSSDAC